MSQGINIPAAMFLSDSFRPSIVTRNRLEGRPRKEDFDRSLRAEVSDALWKLCRQWQFGEFQGEDAGSAVLAKVQVDTARIDRYAVPGGAAVSYDETLPLEAKVERETIPMDLATRVQAGRHWLRLLRARTGADHRATYLTQYAFDEPTESEPVAHLRSDQKARQLWEAVKARVVDGGELLEAIRSGAHAAFVQGSAMSDADKAAALAAADAFLAWYARVYSQPEAGERTAWAPRYLEYQFACSTPADKTGATQTVLVAEQYHHGHLDWYSFDIGSAASVPRRDPEGAAGRAAVLESPPPLTFIPDVVEFAGMPNVRWWEFEDQKTDFGDIRASTTDLPLLMLAEFGLIYGNDWSVLPYDLPVGTLCEVRGIVVTDVFGVRTFIRPAGRGADEDWQRWSMYNLTRAPEGGPADLRLLLVPATGKLEEGSPIENVLLTRDEMANMVFGIEATIPGVIGKGISGHEAAADLLRYLTPEPPQPPAAVVATDAVIRYQLGTTVPENWIPFIPVHNPGSNRDVRLQRAAMPRLVGAEIGSIVTPRGAILRHGLDVPEPQPYFVLEEGVPQVGANVTRTFQRARWWDGRIVTWLGRRKAIGRWARGSGLTFDQIVPRRPAPAEPQPG